MRQGYVLDSTPCFSFCLRFSNARAALKAFETFRPRIAPRQFCAASWALSIGIPREPRHQSNARISSRVNDPRAASLFFRLRHFAAVISSNLGCDGWESSRRRLAVCRTNRGRVTRGPHGARWPRLEMYTAMNARCRRAAGWQTPTVSLPPLSVAITRELETPGGSI